jgi:hypothetical protein
MEFEYEISADDYAAASVLFYKLGRKRINAAAWAVLGMSLIAIGLSDKERGLSSILLAAIGVWWAWAGLARLLPGESFRRKCRKYYQELGLEGQKYRATVTKEGFEVLGENRTWRNPWPSVSPKGEDARVFMLHSGGTLFIFAKRHLSEGQQMELRMLAGLSPP